MEGNVLAVIICYLSIWGCKSAMTSGWTDTDTKFRSIKPVCNSGVLPSSVVFVKVCTGIACERSWNHSSFLDVFTNLAFGVILLSLAVVTLWCSWVVNVFRCVQLVLQSSDICPTLANQEEWVACQLPWAAPLAWIN